MYEAYHKASFTFVEGLEVCCIAHKLILVDTVQAVAHCSTLPQAAGPMCSIVLQICKGGAIGSDRQHSMKLRLHAHQQRLV